ncbi:hypothetical protein HYDPIDRAFT_33513 [Hydnomerulius pinastri MD-312]|uniref:Anaphase-promoting complex subunit 4 WD40 domain-containing protein n=1 Tax=Hydnomerulius pinastri MD-312 TaxID=994086 RepID=A0A0C9W8S3_9AGAM|nr:hypothetical protein HYDPIDRAFT_33513 [Hydnomerulius pinastri MD-312]
MFSALKSLFARQPQYRYMKVASFTPNVSSIHAVAISNDGQVLACGGAEGVKLWDIKSRKEISYLSSGTSDACGAVSCATWVKTKHSVAETLCYGTGLGYLVFLRPNPVDVTCIAWDQSWSEGGSRIAVGMRDNVIQVLQLNPNSQLQSLFAGRLESTVPKSIAFAEHGNVYIFGLYDGNIIKMDGTDGAILSEHRCKSVIGCAAVSLRKGIVVIDNATNGFTLYRLDSKDPICTYVADTPTVPVPKQVAFGEDSKVVVGGSDNGSIYIFDRRSGKLVERLQHSSTGLVQTITADVVSLQDTLVGWAADVPQVSKWWAGFPMEPMSPVAPTIPLESAQQESEVHQGHPKSFEMSAGGKNDMEMLQELAQHLMDLAREANQKVGGGESDKVDRKLEKVERSLNNVDAVEIIYL